MARYRLKKLLLLLACLVAVIQISSEGAWGQKTEVVPQIGHSALIQSAALSRDGALAISGSVDQTAKLWDVRTGVLI